MDKKKCAEAFILLNSIFAAKYQEAWVKLFRQDDKLSLEWINCFIEDGIDSDVISKVVSRVKADDRYSDYPPNLNAFLNMALSIKFSNILDDEDAYLSFCTNRDIVDNASDFLVHITVKSIGSHRLKTLPNLAGSFKKIYNKNRKDFIAGGLKKDYDTFILKKNEKEQGVVAAEKRNLEEPSFIADRLRELSGILKK